MNVRDLLKKLHADGWKYKYSRGSHQYYTHPTKPGKIPVPNHPGDIPIGTLNNILKQAGLK